SWLTETESNNSHFDIEVSRDGKTFTKVTTVQSQHKEGYSDHPTEYKIQIGLNEAPGWLAAIPLALLSLMGLYRGRKKLSLAVGFCLIVLVGTGIGSCKKSISDDLFAADTKIFLRITQVDKNGDKAYSRVIEVVREK